MPTAPVDPAAFLAAPPEAQLGFARDPANAATLQPLLGPAAYDELRALAGTVAASPAGHLGIDEPRNVIFVPGVMGSLLQSQTFGGVWWVDVTNPQRIGDLALDATGTADADPNHAIVPATTMHVYAPFMAAILGRDDLGHVLFPYDWRKNLDVSAAALRDTVHATHAANGGRPVHIVAHSMGGLVARTMLLRHGDDALWAKLGRIVFVGTPHYGSPAIASYLKHHFWGLEALVLLRAFLSRPTFRTLEGVLTLLPAPRGVYPGTRPGDVPQWANPPGDDGPYVHPCANFDLYDAAAWRLEDLAGDAAAQARLQAILDRVADLHVALHAHHATLTHDQLDRMLVIAGVGFETLFRFAYQPGFLGLWEKAAKTTARVPGDPNRDGDGRVPVASAALEHVQIRYVRGVHGGLTNIPAAIDDVFRFLTAKPLQLPTTPAGALAGHLAADTPSPTPHLDGSAAADPFGDDAGLWRDTDTSDARTDALVARLAAGEMPGWVGVNVL